MSGLSKCLSLLIIIILAVSSLVLVETAFGQSTSKPSAPKFSVRFVKQLPNAPNFVLVIDITDKPFTLNNESRYYQIRSRFLVQNWSEWYTAEELSYQHDTNADWTMLILNWDGSYVNLVDKQVPFPNNAQISVQMQTIISNGETSDWTPIQTVITPKVSASTPILTPTPTITPTLKPTNTPTLTPSPTLTPAPTPTPTITGSFTGNNATVLSAIIIVAVVAIVAGLIVYFKKRKH